MLNATQAAVERDYEPRKWKQVTGFPDDIEAIPPNQMYYVCTSDSRRFQDILVQGVLRHLVLVDHELLSLDHETTSGCLLRKSPSQGLCLTVFMPGGAAADYVEDKA